MFPHHPYRLSDEAVDQVVAADCGNDNKQPEEQPVDVTVAQFFADAAPQIAAQDAADYHHKQDRPLKFRDGAAGNGADKAGGLGKQDHVQGVERSRLGIHGEKIVQHGQIDRAAADSQKGG